MNQNSNPGRIAYLDGLKTFALLLVFALHTQRGPLVTDPCHNPVLFYAARCCMPLFFMVNGCLLLRKEQFSFTYYKQKMLGILRALVISGVLVGIYVLVVHHFSFAKAFKEMLKGFLSYTPYAFLWYFYTFAILYTVLLLAFPWVKAHMKTIVAILALCCLAFWGASLYSIANGRFFVQEHITQRLRLWTWFLYFCLGYLLSTLDVSRFNAHFIRLAAALLTAACVGWQYWLCYRVTGQVESNYLYDDPLIIIWSALVFLMFMVSPGLSVWFARFAKYSYGAFLLHGFLVDALQLQSAVHGPLASTAAWAALAVFCWACSWLFSKIPVLRQIFSY